MGAIIKLVMAQPKLDDKTIYLIDGSGYIFRAFFAIRSLHSKSGVPTNAVYGFTNMLLKLLKEHQPRYVAIAFDKKEPTFRHHLYAGYKANRPAPPAELVPQFALIHRLVEAFNIRLLAQSGFEADDVIGTLAKRARAEGREVVIVTGDKDFMQLLDEETFLLDELRALKNGEQFISQESVKNDMGVAAEHVVDLLALAGDTSDNVPGVAGIGKKTAAELINEFGPVEKILERIPLIKQASRREKLMTGYDNALLSKKLVTIDCNVPLDCSIDDLHYSGINEAQVVALFTELDFNRLLQDRKLFKQVPASAMSSTTNLETSKFTTIMTDAELTTLCEQLISAEKIALHTVSDASNSASANLLGFALACDQTAAYLPFNGNSLMIEKISSVLRRATCVIAHDAKHHLKLLTRHGFAPYKLGGDPMLASYLLHQDQERHQLEELSSTYLHHQPIALPAKTNYVDVDSATLTEYAADRARLALKLEEHLLVDLKASSLEWLYYELELPLEEVLSRMELAGVLLDLEMLSQAKSEMLTRLQVLEQQAHELAGAKFNLGSPKQVAEILFEKLALPSAKKTKTGFSTDAFVLERLSAEHPIAAILLEHRMCAKLINTYLDVLPSLINAQTGRLHTTYNQFVAATGRLSSSDPNLQNIPVRTVEGRKIRKAFVAKPGYQLISLDYSQVELRLLAFISNDAMLKESFAADEDVHRRTASEIFDVPQDQVTKSQRAAAKTINFGILYGMGVHRLAQTLAIDRKKAQAYLDKYFATYAGIFIWKTKALKQAQSSGEVRTLFGRKRVLPELASKNPGEVARGERIAINTPIQGTAADIIKKAMLDTDAYLRKNFVDARLIMQVHDELVIEAKEADAPIIAENVAKLMSSGHGLDLYLKVDYGIASSWDEAH